ncbi:3D domain-containing protein [Candidatus Uhrbacteria bacterium]|nr:3D domain-containing protein [Candidatus Uhrbacteria bacterium]
MKSLTIILLGAFFAISQPIILEASESTEFTDISHALDIRLETGEIFTIPIFLPGIIQDNDESIENFQEQEEKNLPEKDTPLGQMKKEAGIANKKIVIDSKEKIKKGKTPQKTIAASSASKERVVIVTAYSSTADQTDSSPCITANGFNVCEHNRENIIAANFLPFGTRVRLPTIYGEKVFTVQDRMHPRHASRVDIWMKTRTKAKQFGVKRSTVEIVPEQVALQQ